MSNTSCKVKELEGSASAWQAYRRLTHGGITLWRVIRNELLQLLLGNLPGALGLVLRSLFYPSMFNECGKGVVFGRSLTLRHPHKITLGRGCVIDDFVTLDAKGDSNRGIGCGPGVYVGRHSIIYCKGGDILLEERVNLSANCTLFSSNSLTIGAGCMIGAYSYFLSGGEYDYRDATPFAGQSGMCTKGPTVIGPDCWFGARVTVLDGVAIGRRCVVAASAVVNKPLPEQSLAAGLPARVIKRI